MLRAFLKINGEVAAGTMKAFSNAVTPVYDQASDVLKAVNWKSGSAASYLQRDPRVRQAIKPWLDCGFGIYMSEGNFYPGADIATLDKVAPNLPPDLRAWIRFLKREGGFDDVVQDDNGLRISWEELADRLHRWENFLRAHPSLEAEIRPEVHRMAWFFFFGLGNTPISDFDSPDRLIPGVLAAWKRFANNQAPSRYTPTMRSLLTLVNANGNKMTAAAEALTAWIEQEWMADVRARN